MNTMRPTTSTASGAVPALLAAVVASIVLGIIGMHALSTHGVTGMSTTDHSTMTSPVTGPMTGSHADMSGASDTSPVAGGTQACPLARIAVTVKAWAAW